MNHFEILLWSSTCLLAFFYFSYYSLMVYEAKKPNNVRKQRIFPTVSLVIPTYNEGTMIRRKLENIRELNYPKEKLEVLVVDSGSSDSTREIVKNFTHLNKLNLQLITQPQRMGKASALNFAWQHCHGEVVIISDADTIFEKSAVKRIVQNFGDPSIGAATGRIVIVNAKQSFATELEKSYRSIYEILRIGESNMDSTPIFNGPIAAFRRKLLDRLELDTVADDTELSLKTREKGWRAIYDPEAIAYEYTPTKFKSRIEQKTRRGQGVIQSFIRHRKILFNSKFGKYGLLIFPCEFFMHLVSPILIMLVIILTSITLVLNLAVLIPFLSITILLLIAYGLILLAQRIALPNQGTTKNPISILTTFLNHQLCLILCLPSLITGRTMHEWKKIEDIRALGKQGNIHHSE